MCRTQALSKEASVSRAHDSCRKPELALVPYASAQLSFAVDDPLPIAVQPPGHVIQARCGGDVLDVASTRHQNMHALRMLPRASSVVSHQWYFV